MATGKSEVKPTAAVVLDTRRQKANGTYPVRLRITYQRDRKYYTLKLDDFTAEEWEKMTKAERLKDKRLAEIKTKVANYEKLARDVFAKTPRFTFARFEEGFFTDHTIDAKTTADSVFSAFAEVVKKLRRQGRISTASTYETAANSLRSFQDKLQYAEVTPTFLEDYESHLTKQGKSPTTVGIYLRNLRAIFNTAKAKGLITADEYPFGKERYQIPAARNVKKALTLAEIEQIYKAPTEAGTPADRAKDFWFFSYLCNGMNVKDICRLRWKDIADDRLTFVRAKTARTKKGNQKSVVVILTPEARAVIDRQGSTSRRPDDYLFDILPPDVTPQRERELVQYLTRSINKYVRRLAADLGITKPVTTYTARHSFSTVLKRSGAPIEFISESLGHHDLRTTESYLDSFEDDVKKQYAQSLLNFAL